MVELTTEGCRSRFRIGRRSEDRPPADPTAQGAPPRSGASAWRRLLTVSCIFAVLALASSCESGNQEPASLCDAASSVRQANSDLADALDSSEKWPQKQDRIARALQSLELGLDDAQSAAEGDLTDDLRLWLREVSALRSRIGDAESAVDLLHGDDERRPEAEALNPALDRIDNSLRSECGFIARLD